MEMVACIYCKSGNVFKVDRYKCLAEEDERYFDNMNIYKCHSCNLTFAHPIPSDDMLNEFYTKIYRKKGRPHYISNSEKISFNGWSNAQFAYISQYFDFKSAGTVLDVGPGYGFLLREIGKHHPHLRLVGIDPDMSSLQYLNDLGIETESMVFGQDVCKYFNNKKVELIISSHSLEHMSDPKEFFRTCFEILSEDGLIFLEVPNCEFVHSGYLPRPYDSPHLLFFNIPFLKTLFSDLGLDIINLSTAGMPMEEEIKLMNMGYDSIRNNSGRILRAAFNVLKSLMPEKVKTLIRPLIGNGSLGVSCIRPFWPYQYGGNRWTIRAVVKMKE